MAMCIEFNDSNARLVEDLLHFGDIGDQRILYGSWRNHTSYYGFIFTKCKKNLIKVYSVYRGYIHNSNLEKPVAEIRRSNKTYGGRKVKWLRGSSSIHHHNRVRKDGATSYIFRAFASIGIIQNLGVRFVRVCELWKFQNDEIASLRSKDFSFGFNGKLISQVPKKCRVLFNEAMEIQRQAKNRSARANYANTSTVAKVRNARVTKDYSKLEPKDVFKLRNVAIRTELLEHYGQDTVLRTMNPDVVDRDIIDGREYELLRFDLPFQMNGVDEPTLATYLKMINPSTGESCIEGVPNNKEGSRWSRTIDMDTVYQALRWRDGDHMDYVVPQVLT